MSSSEGRRERSLFTSMRQSGIQANAGLQAGKTVIPANTLRFPSGRQITVSENHVFDRKVGHYTGGGPFYTDKLEDVHSPVFAHLREPVGEQLSYSGLVYCPTPSKTEIERLNLESSWSKPRSEDGSDLDTLGATAISQVSPVNPASTLGTSLSESFKEGLPSLPGVQLWKKKAEIARAAAGEFLNAEFGWLPLVSEVKSVRDTAKFHSEIMKQYRRDEGRPVHREFHFPIESSTAGFVTTGSSENQEVHTGRFSTEPATRSVSLETETRKWFKGCFTYGLPHQHDSWGRALGFGTDADKLYGIALTPDTLWELAPWSWAIDWFTNAGDVINNVSNFALAGQIMRYGYMMEESITRITCTLDSPGYFNTRGQAGPSVTRTHTSKIRRPANPFGFGLTLDGLSTTQVLIAAAVGITLL